MKRKPCSWVPRKECQTSGVGFTWGGAVGKEATRSSWSFRSQAAASPLTGNVSMREEAYLRGGIKCVTVVYQEGSSVPPPQVELEGS